MFSFLELAENPASYQPPNEFNKYWLRLDTETIPNLHSALYVLLFYRLFALCPFFSPLDPEVTLKHFYTILTLMTFYLQRSTKLLQTDSAAWCLKRRVLFKPGSLLCNTCALPHVFLHIVFSYQFRLLVLKNKHSIPPC